MALQTLPPLASKYSAAQLVEIDTALARLEHQWRRMGVRFDTGWMLIAPQVAAIMADAQRTIAGRAVTYVPSVLEDTGQIRSLTSAADTNVEALIGVTGAGLQVDDSLSVSTIRAKQAIDAGATPQQALGVAGNWLSLTATTILADTARTAESLGRYTRNVGYVRMVHGGACGRCVVLAGRWYRTNAGFLRHARCKCTHIPASEDVAGDWQTTPDEYFHSLNPEQQIKLMGSKANAQAVIDGADMGQVVNAYRKTSGMQFAQVDPIKQIRHFGGDVTKFTLEGTTRRGQAYKAMQAHPVNQKAADYKVAGGRYARTKPVRVMPETIAARAKSPEDRLRLLRLYGWIL